jgi:hypothetical protein
LGQKKDPTERLTCRSAGALKIGMLVGDLVPTKCLFYFFYAGKTFCAPKVSARNFDIFLSQKAESFNRNWKRTGRDNAFKFGSLVAGICAPTWYYNIDFLTPSPDFWEFPEERDIFRLVVFAIFEIRFHGDGYR